MVDYGSVRPSRKVYRITDIGRNSLVYSLMQSSAEDTYRSSFAFLTKHANLITSDQMSRHLHARREFLSRQLLLMEQIVGHQDSTSSARSTARLYRCMLIAMDKHLQEHFPTT